MLGWNGDEERPERTSLGDIGCLGRAEIYVAKLCKVPTTNIHSFVAVRQIVIAVGQFSIGLLNIFRHFQLL
jgi:hypothetical protein